MKTKIKFIGCILMLLIIATTGIWADELKVTPTSPTNEATAGLSSTEADQFMSVLDWSNVKFDKVFTYAGFSRYNKNTVDLGAAFKAGPLYIGSWYNGELGKLSSKKIDKIKTDLATDTEGSITNKEETKNNSLEKSYDASHKAVVLLGFGNIGINLGYKVKGENSSGTYKYNSGTSGPSYTIFDNTVTTNTNLSGTTETKYDPKGFDKAAKHYPFVGFGMNIALGKLTLSPAASFTVIIDETSKKAMETTINNYELSRSNTKENKAESSANVGIKGAFGVDLGLGDSVNSSFNLGYDFTVNVYDKTYTDAGGKKHKIKGNYTITEDKLKDEYNVSAAAGQHRVTKTFEAEITKKSYFSNTLKMGYKMQKDFDRLSLFAGVEAPMTLTLETDATQTNRTVTTKVTYIDPSKRDKDYESESITTRPIKTVKKTTIGVDPKLSLGLSYAAIPSKLFLNFGANVNVFGGKGYSTKITKTTYNTHTTTTDTTTTKKDGQVTKNTKVTEVAQTAESTTTTKYGHANVAANVGIRWQIVDNAAFDVSYSIIDEKASYDRGKLTLACTIKF